MIERDRSTIFQVLQERNMKNVGKKAIFKRLPYQTMVQKCMMCACWLCPEPGVVFEIADRRHLGKLGHIFQWP